MIPYSRIIYKEVNKGVMFLEEEMNINNDLNVNKENESFSSNSSQDVSGMDFLLFLILILLFLGNQSTFNSYFQVFDKEVNKLTEMLSAFKTTADGLKSTFSNSYDFQL